jgi:23S rRNA G2069 N7-methylase RlmK/C1962 C5-methylase RlmI
MPTLNQGSEWPEIEWIEANAFDLLKDYSSSDRRYDTIVLDPPAFAKTKRDLDAALRGYKELNLRALKMLRPGGILVTCSCSYHVSQPISSKCWPPPSTPTGRCGWSRFAASPRTTQCC